MVEAMCSITVSAVLLVVCVGWIHQTLKYSSRVTEMKRLDESLNRLSYSLRNDVRSCESMELDRGTLTLSCLGGKLITYSIDGNDLQVETKASDSKVKQEQYALPDRAIVRWDESEMPDFIGLIVSRQLDIPKRKTEKTNSDLKAQTDSTVETDNESPIELHVRVSAKRWSLKPFEKAKDEAEKENREANEKEDQKAKSGVTETSEVKVEQR